MKQLKLEVPDSCPDIIRQILISKSTSQSKRQTTNASPECQAQGTGAVVYMCQQIT